MLIGVDIGGTFTDLALSQDGQLHIHKLLSTPHDPAVAMLEGLTALSDGQLAAIQRVSHGTTVATNAILERKGSKVALITTAGFRDLLFIGRQERPELYALHPTLPPPLIPRNHCYGVPERLDHTGVVQTPLDIAALDVILNEIEEQQIEAVAICLLYSYVNPAHERAIKTRILERGMLGEGQIALSCDVLPEFREYERASTVALDAYVRPVMSRYLQHLEDELPDTCSLRVMKSDGGVISAARARQQAVQTALSGPAAGVIGAFHLAKLAGYDHIITMDIGGTSTDVAICPGEVLRRPESQIGSLPLRIRLLDIETVGAGGGSIARIDAGGALRVGPESAGADPGPIIYGRGGQQITVSDANALLGRLDADHFLGGRMTLELDGAQDIMNRLAEQAGLAPAATALGVIDIANVNIDRALRRVSIARGYDPRDFTLVAFGGAGPLHACEVAERLQIPRVLIPRTPGVLCAFGLLMADVMLDYSRSLLQPVSDDLLPQLASAINNLRDQTQSELSAEGIAPQDMIFSALLDMRYTGQAHELTIPLPEPLTSESLNTAFHQTHQERYGHAMPERPVEVVNLRLQATGLIEKPTLQPEPITPDKVRSDNVRSDNVQAANIGQKEAIFSNGSLAMIHYDRDRLTPGDTISGPALLFQLDSTVYVAPGWSGHVDSYHNLILEHAPKHED